MILPNKNSETSSEKSRRSCVVCRALWYFLAEHQFEVFSSLAGSGGAAPSPPGRCHPERGNRAARWAESRRQWAQGRGARGALEKAAGGPGDRQGRGSAPTREAPPPHTQGQGVGLGGRGQAARCDKGGQRERRETHAEPQLQRSAQALQHAGTVQLQGTV